MSSRHRGGGGGIDPHHPYNNHHPHDRHVPPNHHHHHHHHHNPNHHPHHHHPHHRGGGRGRGISNAPAWMTADNDFAWRENNNNNNNNNHPSSSLPPSSSQLQQQQPPPLPPPNNNNNNFRRGGGGGGPPLLPPPPHRRGGGRNYGNRSGIYFNSLAEERAWVEDRRRKRRERKSLFDIEEPTTKSSSSTTTLPPSNNNNNNNSSSYHNSQPPMDYHNNGGYDEGYNNNSNSNSNNSHHHSHMSGSQTRHARRLYIGHLPVELSEREVHDFFRQSICTAMEPNPPKEDPILSVYINVDRRFAFVELKSMELCTASLALDGINVCGKGKVKIKRPNDYNAALAPPPVSPHLLPEFDVSKLGIVSGTVPDGPNKIFIGGLPYHLTEDQVMELLSAFGKVKAFHLVKAEPTASTSKGYCFVEYAQGQQVTPVAVMGLNGMDMGGGKILSARIAATKSDTTPLDHHHHDSSLLLTTTTTTTDEPPTSSSFASSIPQPIPTMNVVNGIDVNLLLDAAMGLRPMPTLESLLMEQHLSSSSMTTTATTTTTTTTTSTVVAATTPTPVAIIPTPTLPMPQLQTRVLVLLNMVTDQDFDTDEDYLGLVDDVKTECEKFGKLKSYKIPKPGDAYAPSAIKKIFLEYATLQDAIQAEQGLAGRSFGPALVEATYFDEQKYAAGDLS